MARFIWIDIIDKELIEQTGKLDLGQCGLKEIPEQVKSMSWLKILILGNNEYAEVKTENQYSENFIDTNNISSVVNNLRQLKQLSLSKLNLISIPIIAECKELEYLDLSSNQIKEIKGLEKLTALRILDLSHNQIQKINGLENLSVLNSLQLSYNKISEITGLENLKNLNKLFLNNNTIGSIEGLDELKELNRIDLFSNQITLLTGFGKQEKLNALYLYSNRITEINGLENLKMLNTLDLYDNEITKIENLENLTQLSELSLSYNTIKKIEGLEHQKSLTKLNLSRNEISNIESLQSLTKLYDLNLSSNKILKIESFELFPLSLTTLFLYDNPIENINKTVFGSINDYNCLNDLKNFFAEDVEVNVPEVKLILTGNSDVGKTKFCTYLIKGEYNTQRSSTHGLKVHSLKLSKSIKRQYDFTDDTKIYIWDFGGQEYFHNTHQLFFNQSAVYIFLWEKDTNKNQPVLTEISKDINGGNVINRVLEHFDASYWLSNIRHFAEDATIIVVQNKVDNYQQNKEPFEWLPYETVKQYKCGNQYHISISKSAAKNLNYWYDFEKLKYVIFSELKNFVSKNKEGNIYNQVRKEIEKRKKENYWKAEDFEIFIDDLKKKSLSLKAKDIDNKLVIEHFCRQGKVLFPLTHNLDPGKVIFTDPQWLSEKIYKILNDAVLQRNGFFDEQNLQTLVANKTIENNQILRQIIDLMIQYNIVFYNAIKSQYVAPQYLPEVPTIHFSEVKKLLFLPQLVIKIDGFLPKSVINNIIAKYAVNDDTADFYKYGVKTQANKNILLIDADYGNKKIYVYTDAKHAIFIRDVFANIIKVLGITQNISEPITITDSKIVPDNVIESDNEITNAASNNILVSIDDKIFVNWVELWNSYRNNPDNDYCTAEDGNMVLRKMFAPYFLPYNEVKSFKTSEQKKPNKLFISYSSKNTEFMRRFETHLEPLKRNGMIELWHDRMIEPGTKWDDSIKQEMGTADIIVFLLSPDFIATSYIFEFEIPQAIKQMESDNSKLFFVELQSCSWNRTVLSRFQQTTGPLSDNKGVITIGEPLKDTQWKLVIDELEKKIKK
ncbi:MAG TPA: leucine-rich repeat domain-containing protein [Panacibacter sp.]|nr:leucine-rich repeat domain-containing protein [Panacibacter sp.]